MVLNFLRKTMNNGSNTNKNKLTLKKPNSKHLMTGTAIFIAAILVISGTNITAFADIVQNDIGMGGNPTIADGPGGKTTISYAIRANSGDGQTGCNVVDGSPATITPNLPAGVSANPSPIGPFTSCDTFKPTTFSASQVGSYVITVSVSDSGVGTYNTIPARFILTVPAVAETGGVRCSDTYDNDGDGRIDSADPDCTPADTTKPTVTANPLGGTFTSAQSVVLTASETAKIYYTTDGTNPSTTSQSFQTTGTVTISNEGTTVLKFFAVDTAGNVGDLKTETYVIDTKVPTLTPAFSVQPSADGWFNQPVTVTWVCEDGGTGVAPGSVSGPSTYSGPDTSGFTITGTCSDVAGNKVSVDVVIKYDATTPSITGSLARATPDQNGWYNEPVGYTWECTDALSGVALESQDGTYSGDGEDILISGSCTDKAGNSATADIGPFNFDNTNPNLVAPANLDYAVLGPNDPLNFAGSLQEVSDALSGLGTNTAQCTLAETPHLGSMSVTCKVEDVAGNEGSVTFTMNLRYGTFKFLPPLNLDGSSNVKKGSTLPVKFQLFWGDGVTPAAPNSLAGLPDLTVKGPLNRDPPGGEVEAVSTSSATSGTDFRYDSTSQQYIFNLSTKPSNLVSGYQHQIVVDLHDGTQKTLLFSVVR